ncbi:MAG: phytanoyl-CoA dioxygenase, partial [Bacteroidota bacterium]
MSKTISYPKFELKESLSKEEIDFFNENGFIHYKNFITRERAQLVSDAIDEKQKVLISKGIKKINGIPIKFGVDENKQPIIQRFPYTSHNVPEVAALYDDARLQNLKDLLPDAGYQRR